MLTTTSTLCLVTALALGARSQEPAAADGPFPPSTAVAEGVSPEALDGLSRLVQSLVDDEEIVGAELLVIKNGRSILHEAYGWRDREAEAAMETNSVFCVRSMTKPVVGAAILMLVGDGRLRLGDRVSEYLPSFDVDGSRDITVEHLLTHTSGLPMSLLFGKDLHELEGIRAVADLGGGYELGFEPGSDFTYSDQGTDTLTALIEVVSEMSAADFVRTRVLEPLDMRDSACVMTEDHPLRARALPKYAGSRGEWGRFWSPDDEPLFPFFLGSQGLYSTTTDYARFMELWRRRGRAGGERLLRASFVRKALALGPHPMQSPTGFPGGRVEYGFLMQIWTGAVAPEAAEEPTGDAAEEPTGDAAEEPTGETAEEPTGEPTGEREVIAFGHTGSDGTHAWVFPEEKAMVLYFTQSRNNTTGLRVEEALAELFLGASYDPSESAPPFEDYLGYYWEGEGDLYRAIVRDGDDLALEILRKGVVPLTYAGGDRWKMRPNPSVVLAFDRSPEGEVTGFHIGDHQELRFEPAADLPPAQELAERIARTHRLDLLETLGPVRMTGTLTVEKHGIEGEVTALIAWPDRFRFDSVAGEQFERLAFDGEQVRYISAIHPLETLDGPRAELLRPNNIFARLGDWNLWHPRMQVIQRLVKGDEEVVLVRLGDTSAPATTLYVDTATDRVLREDGLTYVETLGRIGQRVTFGDYRDVSGMLLPFRSETLLANPMIGTIATTIDEIEFGVELPDGAFELRE